MNYLYICYMFYRPIFTKFGTHIELTSRQYKFDTHLKKYFLENKTPKPTCLIKNEGRLILYFN